MSDNLPMNIEAEKDSMGTVTFANEVIAIIAGIAATDVPGVAGMAGGVMGGVAEMLGRKNLTKGVKAEVGSEQVAIDVSIIVDYGVRIIEVSNTIQENIKKQIENMTGLHVIEVNVHVLGVRFEKELPPVKEPEALPAPRVR